MNEQTLYYFLMFFAGAILARVTFYFQNKKVERDTIHLLSAQIISIFEFMLKIQKSYLKDRADFYTDSYSWDYSERSKYLNLEDKYFDKQMSIVTLLLISSFNKKFGENLLFKDWGDIKRILRKAEGMKSEEDEG